jgi:hypothetical protein
MHTAADRGATPALPPITALAALALALVLARPARAQDTYEIQVYPSETMAPRRTMLEFHTNWTADGNRFATEGVAPSHHALHETLELTHGFNEWLEVGLYLFTSTQPGRGPQWVGDHIRPRVRVPPSWHWPVGVSLSSEIGYQRRGFSTETWSWEIRPIVDKQIGPLYWSFNPTIGHAFAGDSSAHGWDFAPAAALKLDVTAQVTLGVEYYAALGRLGGFDPANAQWQEIFPTVDLNVSPDWELNAGVGIGLTSATDRLLFKAIVGYRFH